MSNSNELLRINDLRTYFHKSQGPVKAVDGFSLQIKEGTALGLVGESGCGKTTVAMSILNLVPYLVQVEGLFVKRQVSRGEIVSGEIFFKGRDLLKLPQEEIRQIRGKEIAMIFQNPIPALNPIEMIGAQVGEAVTAHEQKRTEQLRQLVFDYLGKVDLKDAKKRYRNNPHMFSGGEGQCIMIAMALINEPSLLIADEPTKSLDTIVQGQVLTLLQKMKEQFNLSMLLITHNLAVVAQMSDFVATMYAGKIMEQGDVVSIYKNPRHPYTQALLAAVPHLYSRKKRIRPLRGEPPNPLPEISGCKLHPRCPHAIEACTHEEPPLAEVNSGHLAACLRVDKIPEWQE